MKLRCVRTCLLLLCAWTPLVAAQPALGPVIENYGPVMAPPPGSYNLDPAVHYKVSMDVSGVAEFPGDRNRSIESAARFLNMHARNGIPAENIEFALIVHGRATRDLLTDEAYEARYNEPNPNTGKPSGQDGRIVTTSNRIYLDADHPSHILLPVVEP